MVLMFADYEELKQKLWGLKVYFQSGLFKATYIQQVSVPMFGPRASCLKSSLKKHSAAKISQWEFLLYLVGKSKQTEF